MSWPPKVSKTIQRLKYVEEILKSTFVDRDRAVELLILATICKEHILLIGPPGTAKTALINRYTELIDTQGYYYLLTRFTEPSELFGPLDLAKFQAGSYNIRTDGMLPEATIVFLDEVFQGSSAILNSLLTLLNERIFYNGAKRQPVPLISLIGASNFIPDDPSLHAFADRFLLRLELDSVGDDRLADLLEQGWAMEKERIEAMARIARGQESSSVLSSVKLDDVLALHGRLPEVDLSPIQVEYRQVIQELRAEGVNFSDRRVVKAMKLLAGAALLRSDDVATLADFWPLIYLWDRPEELEVMKSVVEPRLAEAQGTAVLIKRKVEDILLDLDTLESQQILPSEAALGAHLMNLNKIRKELIADHPQEKEARQRVETIIQRQLQQMEVGHV